MLVLTLLMPPALLGAVLLLGRFEERLAESLTAPPPMSDGQAPLSAVPAVVLASADRGGSGVGPPGCGSLG
ncbi:hypothetical protein [Kitasatospora sp. NPDC059599]|uniref:hypothetical protein n=1 Tax=Kitasatospora sp. NPDC059599 TaxID=3346880 RepID=UPI003687314D